ncbi:MAG: hypothetical protein ACOY9Y_03730 [Bacillota bacterium]
MKVIITEHAKKRLRDLRQEGILVTDVIEAVTKIPGQIPIATRFRGNFSKNGRMFDLVAKDIYSGRLVITVIGK